MNLRFIGDLKHCLEAQSFRSNQNITRPSLSYCVVYVLQKLPDEPASIVMNGFTFIVEVGSYPNWILVMIQFDATNSPNKLLVICFEVILYPVQLLVAEMGGADTDYACAGEGASAVCNEEGVLIKLK